MKTKTFDFRTKQFTVLYKDRRHNKFWDSFCANQWEKETLDVFDKYLKPNFTMIDVGSWIGPTVLYAAHLAKHVYGIEANPNTYKELEENVKLNTNMSDKISVYNYCIHRKNGRVKFGSFAEPGCSTAGLNWAGNEHTWTIKARTLYDFINVQSIQDINFIKIDIEGGETIVVPSIGNVIQKYKPTLFVSLHYWWFKNPRNDIKNIVEILLSYKHIYDRNGNPVNLRHVCNGIGLDYNGQNSDLIATELD